MGSGRMARPHPGAGARSMGAHGRVAPGARGRMGERRMTWIAFDVWSTDAGLNVIIPGTGPDGDGSHVYPPARGRQRVPYIKRCVVDVLRREAQCFADAASVANVPAKMEELYWLQGWGLRSAAEYVANPDPWKIEVARTPDIGRWRVSLTRKDDGND